MIKRQLLEQLRAHLWEKEITLVTGPRQAGKTTLMMILQGELEKQGKKTVFFNLDVEADKKFFLSQIVLLKQIALNMGTAEGFVFIDEFQRKENAGLFLKGLYDMNLPYKFIVSGSGSFELKEKTHESLAGRKRVFELSTVNFKEFINYKTNYKFEDKLADFFSLEKNKIQLWLEEYLRFGGYPNVILKETEEEKRLIMSELYQSYLEKDIVYLLGVQKTESFTDLTRLTAGQIGCLANISELANTLGISAATVKDYLWYMQKTFFLEKITPYFRNLRKEISKTPLFYYCDLGMRNYALSLSGAILTEDFGFLFQNFVLYLLREQIQHTAATIHFWRTTDQTEVDFIVVIGLEVIPVEVKYIEIKDKKVSRSFRYFLKRYQPKRGYIVHLGQESKVKIGETDVNFIPYSHLMFKNWLF